MFTFGANRDEFLFGSFKDLKNLVKKLNKHTEWNYALIEQAKGNGWLIEEDLGDDYLNYAMVEVEGGNVRAISDDVLAFLNGMKERVDTF